MLAGALRDVPTVVEAAVLAADRQQVLREVVVRGARLVDQVDHCGADRRRVAVEEGVRHGRSWKVIRRAGPEGTKNLEGPARGSETVVAATG